MRYRLHRTVVALFAVSAAGAALAADPSAPPPAPAPPSSGAYSLNLLYTGELWDNAYGGIRQGASYMNNIDAAFSVDTGKAFGWTGGTFFAEAFYANGISTGNGWVGAVNVQSPIDTGGRCPDVPHLPTLLRPEFRQDRRAFRHLRSVDRILADQAAKPLPQREFDLELRPRSKRDWRRWGDRSAPAAIPPRRSRCGSGRISATGSPRNSRWPTARTTIQTIRRRTASISRPHMAPLRSARPTGRQISIPS